MLTGLYYYSQMYGYHNKYHIFLNMQVERHGWSMQQQAFSQMGGQPLFGEKL